MFQFLSKLILEYCFDCWQFWRHMIASFQNNHLIIAFNIGLPKKLLIMFIHNFRLLHHFSEYCIESSLSYVLGILMFVLFMAVSRPQTYLVITLRTLYSHDIFKSSGFYYVGWIWDSVVLLHFLLFVIQIRQDRSILIYMTFFSFCLGTALYSAFINLFMSFSTLRIPSFCPSTHLKVKVAQSCLTLWDPMDCPWNSPGQNTGVGSLSLLQGIFPTLGSNPGFLLCRQIPYQLSHKGSLRVLEWVAYSFSSGSSPPRNQTGVFCIAGRFFTNWAIREALIHASKSQIFFKTLLFFLSLIFVTQYHPIQKIIVYIHKFIKTLHTCRNLHW